MYAYISCASELMCYTTVMLSLQCIMYIIVYYCYTMYYESICNYSDVLYWICPYVV